LPKLENKVLSAVGLHISQAIIIRVAATMEKHHLVLRGDVKALIGGCEEGALGYLL
jgi:hypothetical protein